MSTGHSKTTLPTYCSHQTFPRKLFLASKKANYNPGVLRNASFYSKWAVTKIWAVQSIISNKTLLSLTFFNRWKWTKYLYTYPSCGQYFVLLTILFMIFHLKRAKRLFIKTKYLPNFFVLILITVRDFYILLLTQVVFRSLRCYSCIHNVSKTGSVTGAASRIQCTCQNPFLLHV